MIVYLVRWIGAAAKAPVAVLSTGRARLSQILARRRSVCPRHPHRHHVGQVDDDAILVVLAVIPRTGQDQTAPLVQRPGDRLKRLTFPGEILADHGDVVTAHRVTMA
jgi:hypothetical protein